MSQQARIPEQEPQTLLPEAEQADQVPPEEAPVEDTIDSLIDELEALATEARRMPFGHKLLIDEDHFHDLIDRLRITVPVEVRQAHRVLDEQDRILENARTHARRMLEDEGKLAALEHERQRVMHEAEREAEAVRAEADEYAHAVLLDLQNRLTKLQNSVQNGIDALQPLPEES